MSLYQGRALRRERSRPRGGRLRRVLTLLAGIAVLPVILQAPWSEWRAKLLPVREVRVEGLRYLERDSIVTASGLAPGLDLLGVDLDRARQALLLQPRVARARVSRALPQALRIEIDERVPVLLVGHGVPWELDSTGVLLTPLAEGVVADVPMLIGPDLTDVPAGTQVQSPEVARGLAWVQALAGRDLELSGQVSEIDVSAERSTSLTLMNGTRVRCSAWPPGTRTLSALRVVLADLRQRGTRAEEVDLRFDQQVIVRPVPQKTGETPRTS